MADKRQIKFIDLFAGIGGFHLAFHNAGAECVFASEWDEPARKTYEANFMKISPKIFEEASSSTPNFAGDITKVKPNDVPDHDVLTGGFPCQPFSQAGFKKGFEDMRGTLFFNIAEILKTKKPRAFFIENVRGLLNHNGGETFKTIERVIRELGYSFDYKIVKASDFGLPQHRPRLYMVGFRGKAKKFHFIFPEPTGKKMTMNDVFDGAKVDKEIGFTLRVGGRGSGINDRRNWDSYLVDGKVRRIYSKEGKKMQGFPDSFEFPVSEVQAMKQLGNSVAVPAIQAVAVEIINELDKSNMRTYNKGEWGELYAAVKILNDRKIVVADTRLSSQNEPVNVSRVFLKSVYGGNSAYDVTTSKISLFVNGEFKKNLALDKNDIPKLLQGIRDGKGSSFSIPVAEKIVKDLELDAIKANATVKADIVMEADIPHVDEKGLVSRTGMRKEGFTIKSMIGAKPTLLNTSRSTNFVFSVDGLLGDIDRINKIDGSAKIMKRLEGIKTAGGKIAYSDMADKIFKKNLRLIDYNLPEIVAALLHVYYTTHGKSDLPSLVKQIIPLLSFETTVQEVEHKIKEFIYATALGMRPRTLWDGTAISGGCIIAKEDGDLVCFTLLDQDAFKEYLYRNIKFDSPSSSRHNYGSIYEKNGKRFINLNIQLRFL